MKVVMHVKNLWTAKTLRYVDADLYIVTKYNLYFNLIYFD
jgi:hypothetical protein